MTLLPQVSLALANLEGVSFVVKACGAGCGYLAQKTLKIRAEFELTIGRSSRWSASPSNYLNAESSYSLTSVSLG